MCKETKQDVFRVLHGSVEVPYGGPRIKRGPLTEDDYYLLLSGESLTSTVNLRKFYDISEPGKYTIQYFTILLLISCEDVCELKSDTVEFVVE
jgi:hypothetical protein